MMLASAASSPANRGVIAEPRGERAGVLLLLAPTNEAWAFPLPETGERIIEIAKATLLGAALVDISRQIPRVIRQPASKLRWPATGGGSK